MAVELRRAGPEDAGRLLANVQAGFEAFREIAPPGWEPPDELRHFEGFRDELADPASFALAAEEDGTLAGHVMWIPLAGLVRLRHLFVSRPHWGSGLAKTLHDAAVAEMARRSHPLAHLFTPAGQGRARRFYEREGWRTHGEPFLHEDLGLELVEYRLEVG